MNVPHLNEIQEKGILWNTRDNTLYEIEVSDRKAFLDAVTKAENIGYLKRTAQYSAKSCRAADNLMRI